MQNGLSHCFCHVQYIQIFSAWKRFGAPWIHVLLSIKGDFMWLLIKIITNILKNPKHIICFTRKICIV